MQRRRVGVSLSFVERLRKRSPPSQPSTSALRATVDNLRMSARWLANRSSRGERRLERETGIEPATNSLEGCDSTTELLPPRLSSRESFCFFISGGEGRTRTFEAARATDLQSAAFDRFATSPMFCCVETCVFGRT